MATNASKNKIEFYSLGKDKDDIKEALRANKNFVDLVLGENNSADTFDNHVFDSLFVDTTQLGAKTYITMDTEILKSDGLKIKCIQLTIDFFTSTSVNSSLLPLTSSEKKKYYSLGSFGNRVDVGIDLIKRTISDLNIGIGSVTMAERNSVKIIKPTENHYGKRLVFEVYDF